QCKNGHKWFATLSYDRNKKTWYLKYRQHTTYKRLTLDDAKKLAYTKK
ncbi:33999_t:CDS:1, partial [Racocetra persica]